MLTILQQQNKKQLKIPLYLIIIATIKKKHFKNVKKNKVFNKFML